MGEFTSRYGSNIMDLPDPHTMCKGGCEGMGVFPIKSHKWVSGKDEAGMCSPPPLTDAEQKLWDEAEAASPTDDGWHFVKCPDCNGTGKRI